MVSWLIKYRPKRLSEIVGQDEAIAKLLSWLKNYRGKGFLAYGPPGVGKTATAYALASEYGFEVIEMNASDFRTGSAVKEKLLGAALQASIYGSKKLLLIDEVDGLSPRQDAGAIEAIIEVIQKSRFPVYLTCNDNWASAVRPLKPYVVEVEFKRPKTYDIVKILERIARAEGIEVERAVLLQIAGQRDVRSAILDFEAVARGRKKVTLKDLEVLGKRDREKTIFDALREIFKARYCWQASMALMGLDKDIDEVMLWIEENIPREYERPEEVARAYDALSIADVFKGRIVKAQAWSLLKYVSFFTTAGVAMAKSAPYRKFVGYKPPKYLQLMAKTKASREVLRNLLKRIARYCHVNTREALTFIPVLNAILTRGALPFELTEEEIKLVKSWH